MRARSTRGIATQPDARGGDPSRGARIITIRNRWGDVIRRVKILPDDREIVLFYVEDDYYDEVLEWRNPGL